MQEARLYFDPARAIADEEEAVAKRGVWLRHDGAPATTDVIMTLDTPDALLLDQTITRIAADLKELGDTETLDVRRAHAVGILADPQHALDLLSGREGASPSDGARAGATNLYLHLTPEDLAADLAGGAGAVSIEKLGAATTALLTDWLTRFAPGRRQDHPPARPRPRLGGSRRPARPIAERCARPWSCATPTASSPAAAATPGPATSTTSPNTCPWKTADRRARPVPGTSHPCAAPTTA